MSADPVAYEVADGIAWVRLDRPDRLNAIDLATRAGLREAFAEVEDDADVRVVVLTGTGRAFCAGVDLKEQPAVRGHRLADPGAPVAAPLEGCTRPVIAAVNGLAVGGGFELALAADLRVAAEDAWFQLTELRIGSLPGSGGTQRLFAALPTAVAWRMLMSGQRLTAERAAHHGLVSDVFPASSFADDVAALAADIAAAAPLSLRAAKLAARAVTEDRLATGLTLERTLWATLADTEDRAEGRAAFREKRPPRFTGR